MCQNDLKYSIIHIYLKIYTTCIIYIMMFVLITIMLYVADVIFPYLHQTPLSWDTYFRYGVIGILGVGAGMVLTLYQEKEATRYLLIGLIIGAIVFYFYHG